MSDPTDHSTFGNGQPEAIGGTLGSSQPISHADREDPGQSNATSPPGYPPAGNYPGYGPPAGGPGHPANTHPGSPQASGAGNMYAGGYGGYLPPAAPPPGPGYAPPPAGYPGYAPPPAGYPAYAAPPGGYYPGYPPGYAPPPGSYYAGYAPYPGYEPPPGTPPGSAFPLGSAPKPPMPPSQIAMWARLSAVLVWAGTLLLSFVFPPFAVLGLFAFIPSVIFRSKWRSDPLVRHHATQSLNSALTDLVCIFGVLLIMLVSIGAFSIAGLGLAILIYLAAVAYAIIRVVYEIIGSDRASNGEFFQLPLWVAFRFVKDNIITGTPAPEEVP